MSGAYESYYILEILNQGADFRAMVCRLRWHVLGQERQSMGGNEVVIGEV